MSGHNKWSTIKNKKAKTDAAKGKIFTKIGREIVIAVKTGGSADPNLNSKLKDVVAKAKAANMPNDNIMRSIKKAAGEGDRFVLVDPENGEELAVEFNDAISEEVKDGSSLVLTGSMNAQGKFSATEVALEG